MSDFEPLCFLYFVVLSTGLKETLVEVLIMHSLGSSETHEILCLSEFVQSVRNSHQKWFEFKEWDFFALAL